MKIDIFLTYFYKNLKVIILVSIFISFFYLIIFFSPLGFKGIIVISLLAFFALVSLNFKLTYYIFLVLIFVPYFYYVHEAVIFSGVVFWSLLINFKGDIKTEVENPLTVPLFLYLAAMLPSLINTPKPLLSLRDMSNIYALVIIFYATMIGFRKRDSMMMIFYFFIIVVLLHSIYVIFEGLTFGRRAFGILGVYYIDFAGLGGIVSLILFIYSKGLKKMIAGTVFLIITLGLIITQTRNAWLSFGVALLSLFIFLIFNSKKYQLKRNYVVVLFSVVVLVLVAAYFKAGSFNAKIEERLNINEQTVTLNANNPLSTGTNSFVSRAFIWDTAVLAFLEHPYLGIGAYSFRFVSDMYYKIPKSYYYVFVYQRTPHITYLQVLTETGILGFFFFMIFIVSIIRLVLRSLRLPKTKDDALLTLMVCWSFVYIIFSMLMTESWLYGQYVVWIGVLLGFLVNNSRLLSSKSEVL